MPWTLREVSVADAMHAGVVTCAPGTSLRAVARTMAAHRIHAVVVPVEDPEGWGLVSDLDLIAAADAGGATTAGELASRPGVYVLLQTTSSSWLGSFARTDFTI